MFGKRFDYKDPDFQATVERDQESIRLCGTASILVRHKERLTSDEYNEY